MTPEQTLYALPPDRFIAARDEAVAQARAAGDKEGAARLAKLRRPTVAAWLVNLLALHRPEQVGELLDLASALRDAQHRLRGDELRALSNRRRQAIARLVTQVRGLAVEAGRPARETLPLAEVEATLTAALADEEVAEAVRAGRVTKAREYAGFGEAPVEPAEDGRPALRVIDGGGGRAPADRRPAGDASSRKVAARDTAARDTAARDAAVRDTAGGRDAEAREERRAAQQAAQAARAEEKRRAEATVREAAAEQERAVRELRDLAAQLDAMKERHAAAEVALREAKLRHRTAQRAVARLS